MPDEYSRLEQVTSRRWGMGNRGVSTTSKYKAPPFLESHYSFAVSIVAIRSGTVL